MQYFENGLWEILQKKSLIAWQEVFNSYGLKNFPPNLIIEVWKDENTLLSVAQSKLNGILAYGWYLGQMQLTWEDFYQNEPFESKSWTPTLEKYILGGEACGWGEQLNSANYDQVLWPRTAATAERLWSPQSVNDVDAAEPRLIDHICRLNRRGVLSGPIKPGFCP